MSQAIAFERSSPVQAAIALGASLCALALLVLVLAYWTWEWFAPRPEPRVEPAAVAGGVAAERTAAASALFGVAPRDGSGGASATDSITLLGIVAADRGRPGYAVLRIDGKQTIAVTQGADVEPGLRLVEVQVDKVILERSGARETLEWPRKGGR